MKEVTRIMRKATKIIAIIAIALVLITMMYLVVRYAIAFWDGDDDAMMFYAINIVVDASVYMTIFLSAISMGVCLSKEEQGGQSKSYINGKRD